MSDDIIGTTMVAHKILPRAKTILSISVGLSDKAKQRFKWIDWYYAHGSNKRLIARHFGLFPKYFLQMVEKISGWKLKKFIK